MGKEAAVRFLDSLFLSNNIVAFILTYEVPTGKSDRNRKQKKVKFVVDNDGVIGLLLFNKTSKTNLQEDFYVFSANWFFLFSKEVYDGNLL